MNKPLSFFAAAVLAVGSTATAAVDIKCERLNPTDPAWKFKTIPGPSKSDVAQAATVTVPVGDLHAAGGEAGVLTDGKVAASPSNLSQVTFLADNTAGGRFLFDLGKVRPVTQFNSYSWHEWNMDQGSRAPQHYTLYASAAASPDPADLAGWTKLADVDTRPNTTGAQWGGGGPGEHDPPRRPAAPPGRLQLPPPRRGLALARFQRGFGLLDLGDQRVEAHRAVLAAAGCIAHVLMAA